MSERQNIITPEMPISTVSLSQSDYGSTTAATVTNSLSQLSDRQQNALLTRFSNHGEHHASPQSIGFGYQSLNTTEALSQESRFPSFVNLPNVSTGRFRSHPMESSSKLSNHRANKIKNLEHSLNVLNHVCIGFITIYLSWLCLRNGLAGTALHAWLVTIGFVFIMAEGIMCHYPANVITFNYNRDTKTRIHWILQAFGGGIGMIGALIKLVQKGFLLQSTHGQLGFVAFLLCGFTMVSGLSALYSMRFKELLSPLMNKSLHNFLGYATFVIALLAQFYGYKTGYFIRRTENDFRDLMRVITLMVLALTSMGPLKALFKKIRMLLS